MIGHPEGLGIYLRALAPMPAPVTLARQLVDHHVRHVAIASLWQEGGETRKINRPLDVRRYADVLAAAGLEVRVWAYPWCGREHTLAEELRLYVSPSVRGVLLDPELGYRWRTGRPEVACRKGAAVLVERTLDVLGEGQDIGVTSYGAAQWHRNFPWTEFRVGYGSPQFYAEPGLRGGVDAWSELFGTIVPSVAAFGSASGEHLREHLDRVVAVAGKPPGVVVWSYPQIDRAEWRVLAQWAEEAWTP